MPKKSPLQDKDKFQSAVDKSDSINQFLKNMGLRPAGGNYIRAKVWSEIHNISLPEMTGFQRTIKAREAVIKLSDDDVFCENSTIARKNVKRRLAKTGRGNRCEMNDCPVASMWNDKPIILHLDHINGVKSDNRIENLRFICPNCHSQTDTYSGRNVKK